MTNRRPRLQPTEQICTSSPTFYSAAGSGFSSGPPTASSSARAARLRSPSERPSLLPVPLLPEKPLPPAALLRVPPPAKFLLPPPLPQRRPLATRSPHLVFPPPAAPLPFLQRRVLLPQAWVLVIPEKQRPPSLRRRRGSPPAATSNDHRHHEIREERRRPSLFMQTILSLSLSQGWKP